MSPTGSRFREIVGPSKGGFQVVVDGFMNSTAKERTSFFPYLQCYEREDVLGSYLQTSCTHARKSLMSPAKARSDFQILAEMESADPPIFLPSRYCFRASLARHFDVSLEELRRRGSARKSPIVAYEECGRFTRRKISVSGISRGASASAGLSVRLFRDPEMHALSGSSRKGRNGSSVSGLSEKARCVIRL